MPARSRQAHLRKPWAGEVSWVSNFTPPRQTPCNHLCQPVWPQVRDISGYGVDTQPVARLTLGTGDDSACIDTAPQFGTMLCKGCNALRRTGRIQIHGANPIRRRCMQGCICKLLKSATAKTHRRLSTRTMTFRYGGQTEAQLDGTLNAAVVPAYGWGWPHAALGYGCTYIDCYGVIGFSLSFSIVEA